MADSLTKCLQASKVSILSVGSGDGSQQKAIVEQGHTRILTTFFDSKEAVLRKYPHAGPTLTFLETNSICKPKYGIDATQLQAYGLEAGGKFEVIMFTFPHTGIANNDKGSTTSNQAMICQFVKCARSLLAPGGEIQITLKNGPFYDKWNVPQLVQDKCRMALQGTESFDRTLFPGYVHRLTKGTGGALKEVPEKQGAKVHVFTDSESDSNSEKGAAKLCVIVWNMVPALTDEDVYADVVEIMEDDAQRNENNGSFMNVLEIRRRFEINQQPDTRQLNRVLYAMAKKGVAKQHAPGKKANSKKPCWELLPPSN
jgi:hypothetical protein